MRIAIAVEHDPIAALCAGKGENVTQLRWQRLHLAEEFRRRHNDEPAVIALRVDVDRYCSCRGRTRDDIQLPCRLFGQMRRGQYEHLGCLKVCHLLPIVSAYLQDSVSFCGLRQVSLGRLFLSG